LIKVAVVVGGAERNYRGKTMENQESEGHGKSTIVTLFHEEELITSEILFHHAFRVIVANKAKDGDKKKL
jgi:hypothetical protein